MKTLEIVLNKLGSLIKMTKHVFTRGNVTTTVVDLTEGIGQRSAEEILKLTSEGEIREFSERLPDGRIITYSLEIEEEILEEEEEIEINSSRKIGTCTSENPEGVVDTVTSVVEGEEITVNKKFSRTVSQDGVINTEILKSCEVEGGESVSVEWSRSDQFNKENSEEKSDAKSFLSESGVMITEL